MLAQSDLDQFTGTEQYYNYMGGLKLTDGVKYLADQGKCYWLLDIIWSYQGKLLKEDFQVWKLLKSENKAIVICEDGNDNILVQQKIAHTDFPLDSVKLYCINKVILLPSEY